jgi:hypothetical protein
VPTYATTPQFDHDWAKLSASARDHFRTVVRERFVPDLRRGVFRAGLRYKPVRGLPGAFEITWSYGLHDGRAILTYGSEVLPGHPHVIWLRIGDHRVLP